MAHIQSDYLEVRYTKDKGRGVFAKKDIPEGTPFERVPLIIVTWDKIVESELGYYAYCWSETKAALAMGYGSLYNHSFKPNAYYEDIGRQTKVFTAYRDIKAGEEVTINYNGDPEDQSNDLGFEVID
ncbi:SET domain-containing protein [Planctomicrobium sp. SH668]|uniref:SET domain-containing protein n=1 Tax=Planctomicrobium sp. SH668 TaxID=3448126 RepID=UPI003F5BC616